MHDRFLHVLQNRYFFYLIIKSLLIIRQEDKSFNFSSQMQSLQQQKCFSKGKCNESICCCDFALSSYSKSNYLNISTLSLSTSFLYAPGEYRASANTLHHLTRFFDDVFLLPPRSSSLVATAVVYLFLCRPSFLFFSVRSRGV